MKRTVIQRFGMAVALTIVTGVANAATVAWRLLQVTPDEERRATIAAEEWA